VQPVAVRILHPRPGPTAGQLERSLATAREANATRLAGLFGEAGADDVRIEARSRDRLSFGHRLRRIAGELRERSGLVVLGSGAIPLAARWDVERFIEVAGSDGQHALANSFYSADVVAIGPAAALREVPDLPTDNALPRWLAEQAGFDVEDLRRRWRLAIDLDSPLDVLLAGLSAATADQEAVRERIARLRELVGNPHAELVIAGRTSAGTLRWIERATASRTRALIEERGLRATGPAAHDRGEQRRPRSVLGLVLDERGPGALGAVLAELGDGAIVDSRVLLAHRLGADEAAWPGAEDRFASDLLLAERIADPWLRALTASARDASIPILLGGHTLVGPGVRLALRRRR
jgi:hypothetical protein